MTKKQEETLKKCVVGNKVKFNPPGDWPTHDDDGIELLNQPKPGFWYEIYALNESHYFPIILKLPTGQQFKVRLNEIELDEPLNLPGWF